MKPAITSMQEFILVDMAMTLFENSSGCKLHRDPNTGKCKFLALGKWRGTLSQNDLPCNFFSLSDHLDMLGVTLMATYTTTRKANGDALQEKMKNLVGSWRSGKFMPLTMRPHSLNCYAYSKLWHRCCTIDMRLSDITAFNKQSKSWLYADMLEKPEELALYRQSEDGGLGLYNIQQRALACQINSFLETSCNPKFRKNQYHEALLNHHVLDDSTGRLDITPYYKGNFFPTIKRINDSQADISNITVKAIYKFLLLEITMQESEVTVYKPFKVEINSPNIQWDRTWKLSRQQMLGPNLTSFLFKLLHQILPTAERVSRILPNKSPLCSRCRVEDPVVETLCHSMFECPDNQGAGEVLLQGLRRFIPDLSPLDILQLNFDLDEELNFPIVWCTATFLSSLWLLRSDKKKVELFKIRADMESKVRLLRESRLLKTSEILSTIFLNL